MSYLAPSQAGHGRGLAIVGPRGALWPEAPCEAGRQRREATEEAALSVMRARPDCPAMMTENADVGKVLGALCDVSN